MKTAKSSAQEQAGSRAVRGPGLPPVGWVEAASWHLPSGRGLTEFALKAGFVAPSLWGPLGWRSLLVEPKRPVAEKPGRAVGYEEPIREWK